MGLHHPQKGSLALLVMFPCFDADGGKKAGKEKDYANEERKRCYVNHIDLPKKPLLFRINHMELASAMGTERKLRIVVHIQRRTAGWTGIGFDLHGFPLLSFERGSITGGTLRNDKADACLKCHGNSLPVQGVHIEYSTDRFYLQIVMLKSWINFAIPDVSGQSRYSGAGTCRSAAGSARRKSKTV